MRHNKSGEKIPERNATGPRPGICLALGGCRRPDWGWSWRVSAGCPSAGRYSSSGCRRVSRRGSWTQLFIFSSGKQTSVAESGDEQEINGKAIFRVGGAASLTAQSSLGRFHRCPREKRGRERWWEAKPRATERVLSARFLFPQVLRGSARAHSGGKAASICQPS